ncbi:hypothetical protein SALBM311S_07489 [Streptomyces alboniger]
MVDGLRGAGQTLHAVDVEGEVLAAGGHDLVVEQGVAVDVGEVGGDQVVPVQSRQMPIITIPASSSPAFRSAYAREVRSSSASWSNTRPPKRCGATSTSRLNMASSVWKSRLAIRSSTCALSIFGMPSEPVRFNSISRPMRFFGRSNRFSAKESLESRQALTELVAVALAIGQVELACHDLLPHRSAPSSIGRADEPAAGVRVRWDDAQRRRSITSRTGLTAATLTDVTGGTFARHGYSAVSSSLRNS